MRKEVGIWTLSHFWLNAGFVKTNSKYTTGGKVHVQKKKVSFEHCIIFIKLTKIWHLEEVDDPICRLVFPWIPSYYLVHVVPPGDRVNIAVKSSTQCFYAV